MDYESWDQAKQYLLIIHQSIMKGKKPYQQSIDLKEFLKTVFFKTSSNIFFCYLSFFMKINNSSVILFIEGLFVFVSDDLPPCKLPPAQDSYIPPPRWLHTSPKVVTYLPKDGYIPPPR